MHWKIQPKKPNPSRNMLAFHFLRALARIRQTGAGQASLSFRTRVQQGRRIKRAAYASIALTAGPRRAWSRAILFSLQRGAGVQALSHRRVYASRKARVVRREWRKDGGQVSVLRRLVPGGRRMDLCSLLEETENYIHCLTAQVHLMKKIADSMSK